MERESFEDIEVADILNKYFVSIKVDREERVDIDNIYMNVCQMLTGHGGWPLTIIMTPEKKPFYAGTYFPKQDKWGMIGLLHLLEKISNVWKKDRASLIETSEKIISSINQKENILENINIEEIVSNAYFGFKNNFDGEYGGFGSAPKFPMPHSIYFLLRYWYIYKDEYALEMVEKTLDSMRRGGIYDNLGFGFSRYSTDEKWLIPHFEKMLYDNALIAIGYLEAFQVTKKDLYADISRQIFSYVLSNMTSNDGGFFSAEDADSEGEEGKYYSWSIEEIRDILGKTDAKKYCAYFNISENGNFSGKNIPNLIGTTVPEQEKYFIEECRKRLLNYRNKRIHPYKDDKILTSWNGLMVAALAIGGRVLNEKKYIESAEKTINFIITRLVREDGRLMARYRDGEAANLGYVDDYSFLVWGLIELYEATFKPEYLKEALKFNDDLLRLFWDNDQGGLFLYGSDSEQLFARPKEIYDGAIPSGNSVATLNFLKLAKLTGKHELEDKAHMQFELFGKNVLQYPQGYAFFLIAMLFAKSSIQEIIISDKNESNDYEKMINVLYDNYRPFTLSLIWSNNYKDLKSIVPFIENYKPINEKATAYVCKNYACQEPTTDVEKFKDMLED